MPNAASKKQAVVAILNEGQGGSVRVDTATEDRFVMDVSDVVKACLNHQIGFQFYDQVKELQDKLNKWVEENRSKLSSAYITYRQNGQLLFVAVQAGIERDPELAASLTDLDVEIATSDQFNQLKVEVLAVPKSARPALDAFLSSGTVLDHASNQHAPESSV